jgi:nicotinamidase-related amidase
MRSLLLIIDLQKGWRHKTATEAAMLQTVKLCKQFNGDAIHCCFKNDPASLFHKQLKWYRFMDPYDTDEIPEIAALTLPRYWRQTYSCLTPEVLPIIKRYNQIYIAGVFTDISVAVTAMGIFDQNIPVAIVTDCVATLHGELAHKYALRALEHALGRKSLVAAHDLVDSAS